MLKLDIIFDLFLSISAVVAWNKRKPISCELSTKLCNGFSCLVKGFLVLILRDFIFFIFHQICIFLRFFLFLYRFTAIWTKIERKASSRKWILMKKAYLNMLIFLLKRLCFWAETQFTRKLSLFFSFYKKSQLYLLIQNFFHMLFICFGRWLRLFNLTKSFLRILYFSRHFYLGLL